MYSLARVGVAVPALRVGDCGFNVDRILETVERASNAGVRILVFPELCVTGYSCGDLFYQSALQQGAQEALARLLRETADTEMLMAVGMPVRADNQSFNCGVVLYRGRILGVVPKTYLPNHNEFYEERWFSSGLDLCSSAVKLCGQTAPMGTDLLFACPSLPELVVGVEVCEDLWCPLPPSTHQALHGANVILNLSASNELAAKGDYRRGLVAGQSSRLITAYAYASAGMGESTTDVVFGGHSLICENGALLEECAPFQPGPGLAWADVDIEFLMNTRRNSNSYMAHLSKVSPGAFRAVEVPLDLDHGLPAKRRVSSSPFVPENAGELAERCREIFTIQCAGLARRLEHTGIQRSVIAVSGGLDSTLALLCTARAYDMLERDRGEIIGVTMPGFGTTGRTHRNALDLMQALGVEIREVDIRPACLQHFQDISHSPDVHDTTFENAQARERTQVVMDMANMENGLVVGTGDLSELALGYTTYNGDHMSMYNVNCGVPKTLVRALTAWVGSAGEIDARSAEILRDILDTPVSPELLPPGEEGELLQRTEDLVGPYRLHDFFLYHMVRCGFAPDKIVFLAELAFGKEYPREEIVRWLQVFLKRFFAQQFKRSCVPDGPKVGSVALSPRGDWRMPSDACPESWLKMLDGLV